MSRIVTYLKLIIRYFLQISCRIFRVFPVKSNRLVFYSQYHASQYSDSPKYISEYILNIYKEKYEVIWVFKNPEMFTELKKKGIKIVKFYSLKNIYYSNTAKILVSNMFGPYPYITKRKDRIIIETTHGVAYKRLSAGNHSMKLMSIVDYALSGNIITSNYVYRENLRYRGAIIEEGLPRNDIFFKTNDMVKRKVKEYFGINKNTNVVILMPTWRTDNSTKSIDIDYERILNILRLKNGKEWVFLLRLHHLSRIDISGILAENHGNVIDATSYPDAQELLLTADMLITDYSSVIWDFALQEKPIVVYTPDLLSYEETRGFNVLPDEWMLYSANNEKKLYKLIEDTSFDNLISATKDHLQKFGSFETGDATKLICERIDRYCSSDMEKSDFGDL